MAARGREGLRKYPGSTTSNYSNPYSPTSPSDQEDSCAAPDGPPPPQKPGVRARQPTISTPPPQVLLEEYLQPMSKTYTVASPYINLEQAFSLAEADPMAVHLLLETALAESQQFRILSPDDLDRLKKEELRLSRLIEAGKRKLFIESRVDSTAKLLQRLGPNTGSIQSTPRSPLSEKKSFLRLRTSSVASTEVGSVASQGEADSNKFQELAKEVYKLERRQTDLQQRKLEHTAGILQTSYQRETSKKGKETDKENRPSSIVSPDSGSFGLGINAAPFPYTLDGAGGGFGFENEVRSRLRDVNRRMRGLWTEFDAPGVGGHPQPPGDTAGSAEQLNYLEDCLYSMTQSHGKLLLLANDARRRDSSQEQLSQRVFEALSRLYETLLASETSLREARGTSANSLNSLPEEVFSNAQDNDKPFSLEGFSTKVNGICARATFLEQQQVALQTQIAQEREARKEAETSKGVERSHRTALQAQITKEREARQNAEFAQEGEKTELMEQYREIYNQNAAAQKDIQNIQSQLIESNALLAETQDEIEKTKQQLDQEHAAELAKERNARKAREHDLTTRLSSKVSEVGLLRSAISANEAKVQALEQSEAAANAGLQELVSQLDVVGADLLAAESRLANYQASATNATKQVDVITGEKEELQREAQSLREEIAHVAAELAAAQQQVLKQEFSAKKSAELLAGVSAENTELGFEASRLRSERDALKQSLQDTERRAAETAEHSSRTVSDLRSQLSTERSGLDAELARVVAECDALKRNLEDAARRTAETSAKNSREFEDLTTAKKDLEDEVERLRTQIVTISTSFQEAEDRARDSELALREKIQQLSRLESETRGGEVFVGTRAELESALSAKRSEFNDLSARHSAILESLKTSENARIGAEDALDAQAKQLDELTKKHTELAGRTKVLTSRAETASTNYGSVNDQLEEAQREQSENQARVKALQKELGDMIMDYEHLVKIEVHGEKERIVLENTVDTLRDRVEELEKQLDQEKIRALGRSGTQLSNGTSNGANGHAANKSAEGISIATMRNEFRKMMKDAKAEHHRTLRAEQEERRRLEAIVRSLHRDGVRPQSSALSGVSLDNASLMSASDVFAS